MLFRSIGYDMSNMNAVNEELLHPSKWVVKQSPTLPESTNLGESESMGADLCSVTAIKNEKKAIVSCADGALHVYNWGEFGHPSDIFPGHDKGDLVCCKLNEKVVLTGDFKGNIRPVNIQV